MTLHEFLVTSKISVRELARRCSTSASTIVRLRDFKTIPSRRVIDAVHRETAGKVGIDEMIKIGSKPDWAASTPAIDGTKPGKVEHDGSATPTSSGAERPMEGH